MNADIAGYGPPFTGVAVVGRGVVQAVPDIATFALAAQVTAPSAGEAMSKASASMESMVTAAAAAGVASSDRQTHGMQLSSYRRRQGAPVQHQAVQRLRVWVRDVDSAGEILERILAAGGDDAQVEGSGLTISDEQAYADRARDLAMADARHRAEQLARLADRPLGAVLAVHEESGRSSVARRSAKFAAADAVALAASASAPVEAGEIELTVLVAVEFGWAD
ncbi:SIMPL domain-containing protein [Actinopolymorpha sp. B17G11]|uniref:SIMPL domain-containing protein n=1 Tax=unclassified Actinopolymorpha TaxID=2627063 RepID=UPI0032D996AD